MPKAKPISLHPLSFDEALKALIKNHDQPIKTAKKKAKAKQKKGQA